MHDTATALNAARNELASAIGTATSSPGAYAAIVEWARDNAKRSDLGDAIFIPTVMADMAGQLMVRGRDATVHELAGADGGSSEGDVPEPDVRAFLDQPWEDALAEFKARGILKPTELQSLLADYAQRGDEARQLMIDNIQKRVRSLLEDAIANGETYADFAAKVADGSEALGITTDDPAYLRTVFRTNVQSAYGAGRFRAITSPAVVKARPYVQYRTVGDARVREEHALLDGKVFRSDDPTWYAIAPPNGFNCRCSMLTLDAEEGADADVQTEIPADFEPDPDFNGPPVAKLDV